MIIRKGLEKIIHRYMKEIKEKNCGERKGRGKKKRKKKLNV
jgi:hypothetical protein